LVDIGSLLPGLSGHRVAADVFLPSAGSVRPIVFCCLSGGGMSRRYWDLRPVGDNTYSFARWAVRSGFPVICADHLGTGESTLPPRTAAPLLGDVIAANDAAFRILLDELRRPGIDGARPLPGLRTVGVGHSMGATMTVRQQDRYDTYDAVALLGFDTAGLPEHLPRDILAAGAEDKPDDKRLAELTLRMFGSAYPMLRGATVGDLHQERVQQALDAATTVLLGAGGLLSILPGNVSVEAARLRVPVFVANGERDPLLNGRRARVDQYPDAATFVACLIADSGHNHNVAPARHELWEQLGHWAESVLMS
jgi:alpha-beta hydrolase superfamily lysophospholipase